VNIVLSVSCSDGCNALVRVDKEGRVSTEWREGAADDESRLASFESQFIEKITKLMEWAKAEAV